MAAPISTRKSTSAFVAPFLVATLLLVGGPDGSSGLED